ncbi:phosphonate ABC transporter, permease protein PhnE [Falsiroseomonas selenitidurans]|uniref:Phosphonate ABC transporter, permease protein PhnE n=1 Tax=Falsiroseomonas selenitidurans TaxID=2716335 RepID=A0ABX1DXP1_9PROT|nr:phosphonate ABC transporter, permease protein PhnE [Falsiroseomonas selenitidurans]NKC29684.1 phosphonate ABC transporter, permease protein PhnE [Falsiroseomonas selenitidurans]
MSATKPTAWRARRPELYPPRGPALWRRAALVPLGLGLFLWGLHALEVSPGQIYRGLGELGRVFMLMMPPAITEHVWQYLRAIGETLAMAFLGTLIASLLAVPLALMGARNVMPLGPVRLLVRRSSDVVRGIDSLVWAIFFVSVVGLGPFAGILAIAVNDTGVLTKLFAEAMENTDREQVKGVRATGAGRLQTIAFGIMPQALPVLLANSLYFLESNLRSATVLGVVGAGGIGFYLMDRMMISAWREVSLIVILVLVTVIGLDTLSRALRQRLIGSARG